MSKYTTEVRWICEFEAQQANNERERPLPKENFEGFSGIDLTIEYAAPRIFNFTFPIFDESYRMVLEKKILRHFYTREICEETYGLWKLRLWDKLNVIMPYYNKLYNSELLNFNPLYDVDITTEYNKSADITSEGSETGESSSSQNTSKSKQDTISGTKTNTGDVESNSEVNNSESNSGTQNRTSSNQLDENGVDWSLYSDTPQGGIQLIDNTNENLMQGNAYLTNARKDTTDNTKTGSETENITDSKNTIGNQTKDDTSHSENTEVINNQIGSNEIGNASGTIETSKTKNDSINNVEEYLEHISGKRGGHTYSAMLLEFRKTLLNIDQMILRDLEDLFFGLWE